MSTSPWQRKRLEREGEQMDPSLSEREKTMESEIEREKNVE
jgi:hypothetical protein